MPDRLRYVVLPDGRMVATGADVTDQQLYDHLGIQPQQSPQDAPTYMGGVKRGAIAGAAPAAVGLAAAAPGAEVGAAWGAPFGPIGAGIGGVIGGLVTGIPAGYAASYAQQKVFEAAPDLASALGQSPDQVAADNAAHPTARMVGEALPNLAAFRPSRLPFRSVGNAATPEAANAIRAARINAGVNAGVSGATEAGSEYAQNGEIDPYSVALQAGVGGLGSKETFIGRGLGRTKGILPQSIRDAAARYTGTPIDDTQPENLLNRGYDKRDTWTGPQPEPMALPSPEEAARYDRNYRQQQLTPEERYQSRAGGRPMSDYAFEQSPEGTQGNLFGFPDTQRQSDSLEPNVQGRATDRDFGNRAERALTDGQTNLSDGTRDLLASNPDRLATQLEGAPGQARDPAQLDMLEEFPTANLRQGYSHPELLQRLTPDGAKPDAYTNKVASTLAGHLYEGNGMAANRFIEGEHAALETANVNQNTIDNRLAVLDRAAQELHAYSQQSMQAHADEGMNAARPGAEVNTDPGAAMRQQVEEQQNSQEAQMQQAHAAEQQQMSVGEIREQTLRDIVEHGNPKSTVPEFMKFVSSGKGQWGEVGLRDNERAILDQAREMRRKRQDVKLAVDAQQKEQAARESKQAEGESRRQQMEQRFQSEKSQRETQRALSKTEATREEVPVTPEAEPQPTLADLMAKAKPAETKTGTVLDRGEGPLPTAKAQEAAKPETVSEKIKQKVAAKRAERKPVAKVEPKPKEETPTQAMKSPPKEKPVPKAKPKENPVIEKVRDKLYELRTDDDKKGVIKFSERLAREGVIGKDDHETLKTMAKDRDMGADDLGSELEGMVDYAENQRLKNAEPDEVTYESVLKEADSYLAADGESGLLKPKEYQKLSEWAENETFTPEELKQHLDTAVERRRSKSAEAAYNSKSQTRLEEGTVSRRGFIKGAAAAAASASVPKARAATTPIKNSSDLGKALRAGNLKDALKYVSTNGATPILRKVADLITRGGTGDLKVEVLDSDKLSPTHINRLLDAGVGLDVVGDVQAGTVLGLVSGKGSDRTLFLFDRATGESGLSEQTFMHELIHAYVKSRWYKVSVSGNIGNTDLLLEKGLADPARLAAVQSFSSEWGKVSDAIITAFKSEKGEFTNRQIEAARTPDEMLSYIMEDANVQGLLKRMYQDGDGKWEIRDKPDPAAKAPTTLWEHIVQFFRDLFGVSGAEATAFDKLLDAGYGVLEAGQIQKPDFKIADAVDKQVASQEASPRLAERKAEDVIQKLPEPLRDPAFRVWDTIHNVAAKGKAAVMFTEDLIDSASKLLPTGKDYVRVMADKVTTQRKLENSVNTLGEDHMRLPDKERGLGRDTVNGAIQHMTESDAWGFQPDWLDTDVEINPEAERVFKSLSKSGQEVVRGVFRENYNLLKEQRKVTTENVNTTYDRMIDEAKKAGDTDRAIDLEDERQKNLKQFARLMSMDETKPYASTRRYGNYLVVGKSPEMRAAIAADDTKEINRLKTQDEHYFVNMYETMWEAKRAARQLADDGAFAPEHVEAYEKDRAQDQLVGGKEMMQAFQRLREYIANTTAGVEMDARVKNGIEKLAVDLYLRSLHSTSSRKSELRRAGVGGGDMDMMRNFITQSRATAHLIGALKHNEQVLDTITKMRAETGKVDTKDKAQAMRVYNEIMLRHLAGMEYRPNAFVDNLKSATSMYFLVTSPSYYAQNLTQFSALTAPVLAGKHGYAGTFSEAKAAYREIGRIWGKGVTDALNVEKIGDPNVRRAIQEIADRGGIDIGIDSEMGRFHSMSKGVVSTQMAKVDAFLRNLTRKAEAINRVVTVMSAYKLETAALTKRGGMTPEQIHGKAVEYAYNVNRQTNGSYDGFNAPRFMRTPTGSVVTQFKKFQLMQLTLLGKLATESFKGATPVERAIARKSLAYTMGHTAILAGAMGLPGAAAAQWFIDTFLAGDKDEPGDIEKSMREAIGDNTMADLILKGAPAAGGVDVSSRVGMGQALSLLPFTDIKPGQQGYNAVATSLLGPAIGGMGPRFADGTAKMLEGNYWKGLERFLPKGLSDASAAIRERTQGVTKNNNDMLLDPEDITFADTFARIMGVQTSKVATRYRLSNEQYATKDFYDKRAQEVNNQFANAWKQHDSSGMADARDEFRDLQVARVKNGLSRQPFSVLLRYAHQQQQRERATVRGVQYQPKSPALRAALAEDDE